MNVSEVIDFSTAIMKCGLRKTKQMQEIIQQRFADQRTDYQRDRAITEADRYLVSI